VSPGVLLVEARTSLLQCSYRYQPQPASTVCACFWHGGRFSHIRICRVFTIENNESAVWCHASWKCWLALPLSMQCRVACDGPAVSLCSEVRSRDHGTCTDCASSNIELYARFLFAFESFTLFRGFCVCAECGGIYAGASDRLERRASHKLTVSQSWSLGHFAVNVVWCG